MEHEGQKYSFSEKVAIVVAPVGNFAAAFPTVKQYFVTATVGFFAVGILNIVQLDTVSKKLCEIRPGFVWAHGTDGYNWDDSWYHQNCDCPDTFVTPGGEEACATSTTSSTTQPPVVDLWEMPPRRLETRVPNAFKTSFEGSEVMSAERFSTPNPNFDQDQYSSWLELKYYSRHLQTAADPVYSTSDWGPCQCETTEEHIWGVCGTGFQERTVDCTSSSGCPLSRQPCDCTHCANCQADIFILISAILFLLQAGCAGLVVLGGCAQQPAKRMATIPSVKSQ